MKLAELGEFGFIDRVRRSVRGRDDVRLGIGDDCAALQLPPGELLLTTGDLLIEEVHFRREWIGWEDLGRKSAAVNLSDIAAMGGTPRYLYLGLGVPGDLPLAALEALVAGFLAVAEEHGAILAGGDTCRSPGPLLIAVTAEGSIPPGQLIGRRGAAPGDRLYVSGTLGDSALALRRLQQGTTPEPQLAARHCRPEPRTGLGRALATAGLASAMIDVSDGLLADLGHLLAACAAGARVRAEALPLSPTFAGALAQDAGLLELALAGGEDYELLFTVPPDREERLATLAGDWSVPVTRIGEISGEAGSLEVTRHGEALALPARGFNHFAAPAGD